MYKYLLSGAAFAALMVGPASAADIVVRPIYRAPPTVSVKPYPTRQRTQVRDTRPPQQRSPIGEPGARWGNLCWVEVDSTRYYGYWGPCPRPAEVRSVRKGRPSAGRKVRSAAVRKVQQARTVNGPGAPVAPVCRAAEPKKQYWATGLSQAVDSGILQGLQNAVARGETGWLDVNPEFAVPAMTPGTNLVFYHVGGNCYVGSDCARFPSSKPTGDRWGHEEREIDLNDPLARKIVVADLVGVIRQADQVAPKDATVGVHLDNLHMLDADGLARVINDYLRAVETAKQQGLIAKTRTVGYVAKNNPQEFKKALDARLLRTVPLYQIMENATLSQDGALDDNSRAAQEIGQRYGVPVFLKTFGTDVAYAVEQGGNRVNVYVTQDMVRQMAQRPNVSGVASSPDEARYQPTLYAPGAPVRPRPGACDKVAMVEGAE